MADVQGLVNDFATKLSKRCVLNCFCYVYLSMHACAGSVLCYVFFVWLELFNVVAGRWRVRGRLLG